MRVTLPGGVTVEDVNSEELDVLLARICPAAVTVEEAEIDCEIVEEEDDVEEVEAAEPWPGVCGEMNTSLFFPVPCTLTAGHDGKHSCFGVWSWGDE